MRTANTAVHFDPLNILKAALIAAGCALIMNVIQHAVNRRTPGTVVAERVELKARDIEKQLQCMSRNVYWEAASESFEGKVAVAQVTMNRMESGKFPDSVCGVVYQKTTLVNRVVCQFSWFCESKHLTKPIHEAAYKESEEVAKMVVIEGFRLPKLKEALYYHADYVNPRWNKDKVGVIGRHIFYKDKDKPA